MNGPVSGNVPKGRKSRHGSEHISYLLLFSFFVLSLLVAFDLGYTERDMVEDPISNVRLRLQKKLNTLTDSWKEIRSSLPEFALFEPPRPGVLLRRGEVIKGVNVTAKYPVVLIPGIVTSKLEVWEGKECAKGDFRHQYWGSSKMLESLLLNRQCWMQHIALNQSTGLDPDGIKLRVAEGMSAADFLIGDYWVWERMIHNLADIGLEPNSMHLAAYDWRLASVNLEKRDLYFSKLKFNIECLRKQKNEKVYMIGHSMGSLIVHFFLHWVESPLGGNGGPTWVDENIAGFVNIGGPLLGVSKSITTLMSGDMRDTAELNSVIEYVRKNFISNLDLLRLFRSFSSIASMIPKGSDKVWGNATWAPDDNPILREKYNFTHGQIVDFLNTEELDIQQARQLVDQKVEVEILTIDDDSLDISQCSERPENIEPIQDFFSMEQVTLNIPSHITSEAFVTFLGKIAPKYLDKVSQHESFGLARDFSSGKYDHPRYWNNPLESQLPNAPSMKIFSLYGIGKATERSYTYLVSPTNCSIPFSIAKDLANSEALISCGVRMTDGDGTVPILSSGLMSVKGWKDPIYNPSNITTITREYNHEPDIFSAGGTLANRFRGGRKTADHVDIMGNHDLIMDILLIVGGHEDKVTDRIYSNIEQIADSISFD